MGSPNQAKTKTEPRKHGRLKRELGEPRKWGGTAEHLSRTLPISREDLQNVLVASKSIRAACDHLSRILGRVVVHQSLMDVLRHDPVFSSMVKDAERRYAEMWPLSATDSQYVEYGWLHTLLNRRLERILKEQRWKNGEWPSVGDLVQLFRTSYPQDRWESKTKRRNLLLRSGVPQNLFMGVFLGLGEASELNEKGR